MRDESRDKNVQRRKESNETVQGKSGKDALNP